MMMDPVMLIMLAAAQDPTKWAPMLDALGPQFGPDVMLQGANQLMNPAPNPFTTPVGGPQPPSAMTPGPGAGGWDPGLASSILGPSGVPPMPMTGPIPMPGLPGAPGPGATVPGLSLPSTPTAPNVVRPQVPQPIMSGGVTGAQKAPEMGVQPSAGGTPAQLLMSMLLGPAKGGAQSTLRVPPLSALLAGAAG